MIVKDEKDTIINDEPILLATLVRRRLLCIAWDRNAIITKKTINVGGTDSRYTTKSDTDLCNNLGDGS